MEQLNYASMRALHKKLFQKIKINLTQMQIETMSSFIDELIALYISDTSSNLAKVAFLSELVKLQNDKIKPKTLTLKNKHVLSLTIAEAHQLSQVLDPELASESYILSLCLSVNTQIHQQL